MPLSDEQRKMLEEYLRKQQGGGGVEVPEEGMVAPAAPSPRMVAPSPGPMGEPALESNAPAMQRRLMQQQEKESQLRLEDKRRQEAAAPAGSPSGIGGAIAKAAPGLVNQLLAKAKQRSAAPQPEAEASAPEAITEAPVEESEEDQQRKARMSAMRNLAFGQAPQEMKA